MNDRLWIPFQRLTHLQMVVALYNVSTCEEVDCDPDYTYDELVKYLVETKGKLTKDALERVLFCLNMNDEDRSFWHPLGRSFDSFVKEVMPKGYRFDKYYNLIEEGKETKK